MGSDPRGCRATVDKIAIYTMMNGKQAMTVVTAAEEAELRRQGRLVQVVSTKPTLRGSSSTGRTAPHSNKTTGRKPSASTVKVKPLRPKGRKKTPTGYKPDSGLRKASAIFGGLAAVLSILATIGILGVFWMVAAGGLLIASFVALLKHQGEKDEAAKRWAGSGKMDTGDPKTAVVGCTWACQYSTKSKDTCHCRCGGATHGIRAGSTKKWRGRRRKVLRFVLPHKRRRSRRRRRR